MKIKEYYKTRKDIPKKGIIFKLANLVGNLYDKPSDGMKRVKEDSLSLLTFLNIVRTCIDELENDPIPSQIVYKLWKDLCPLNIKHAEDDFHVSRWYEATIIFGGLYYVFNRKENPDEKLLNQLEKKASYNDVAKPYFDYFKNACECTEPNAPDGINNDAGTKRENAAHNELSHPCTQPQKQKEAPATIDIDVLMKTAVEKFPSTAHALMELLGYIVYKEYGDQIQQFNASKKYYEEKLVTNNVTSGKFRFADGHKGNMAKLIQVICDLGMVVNEDGSAAKPIEEVGKQIGKVFGYSFPSWSQTLKGAFDQNNFADIFDEMRTAAVSYKKKKNSK